MTDGLYYVKEKHGVEVGDWDSDHKIWNGIWGGDDTEVLAPVPSYEEWQASEKYNKHLEEKIKIYERKDKQATETSIAYNELAKENAILKELLKEWVQFEIEENPNDFTVMSERMSELANKTKEVLR